MRIETSVLSVELRGHLIMNDLRLRASRTGESSTKSSTLTLCVLSRAQAFK